MEDSFRFFPLWKRGMKGDFNTFQKAKLVGDYLFVESGCRKGIFS
jgi:hypothetical protein